MLVSAAEMNVSKAEMKYSKKDTEIFLPERRAEHRAQMMYKPLFLSCFFLR